MTPHERRVQAHNIAIAEAKRFIAKANDALRDLEVDRHVRGTPATGAAKRSSMDLTRALANLRRNPWESSK